MTNYAAKAERDRIRAGVRAKYPEMYDKIDRALKLCKDLTGDITDWIASPTISNGIYILFITPTVVVPVLIVEGKPTDQDLALDIATCIASARHASEEHRRGMH
jgi:hypothetical protein